MIIVLEGLDNSGKTIQSQLVSQILSREGYSVIISKELTTDIGKLLKASFRGIPYSPILKTLLFAADRQKRLEDLQHRDDYDKSIVIFDRYLHSAITYRMSEGVDPEWVKNVNKFVPPFDVGFYIDITPEESIKRNSIHKENIHYDHELLKKIRNFYLGYVDNGELVLIDGTKSEQEIASNITEHIRGIMKRE